MALRCVPPMLRRADLSAARLPPKTADAWYLTPEHRTWSKAVVARSGFRCQGDGCGRTGTRLFADHIVEIKDGGARLDPANGRALCGSCHTKITAANRMKRMGRQDRNPFPDAREGG
jgi:5-methylcytosine-specific restriction endonuclease McrA